MNRFLHVGLHWNKGVDRFFIVGLHHCLLFILLCQAAPAVASSSLIADVSLLGAATLLIRSAHRATPAATMRRDLQVAAFTRWEDLRAAATALQDLQTAIENQSCALGWDL
jgi:hypothetical protein